MEAPNPADNNAKGAQQRAGYLIRPGQNSDWGYVKQKWCDGAKYAMPKPWQVHLDQGVFKRFMYDKMEVILLRAELRVACIPNDDGTGEDTIVGFAVVEAPEVLHYVYVRSNPPGWRRRGVASALLEGISTTNSTWTTWSPCVSGEEGFLRSKYKFTYVPFYMREGDEERQRKALNRYG